MYKIKFVILGVAAYTNAKPTWASEGMSEVVVVVCRECPSGSKGVLDRPLRVWVRPVASGRQAQASPP